MLLITHVTEYTYPSPVMLHDHRLMIRPHDSFDLRLISATLSTSPASMQTRWYHDVFGNSIALVSFEVEAPQLRITSTLLLESYAPVVEAPQIAPYARAYPFSYTPDEQRDLGSLRDRQYADPDAQMADWVRNAYTSLGSGDGPIETLALLRGLNGLINQSFGYQRREAQGTQAPSETLANGSGTCRDFALLFMEAARQLGLAARFATGYLVDSGPTEASQSGGAKVVGGGATHAWAQVYIPGLGWVDFDPTNEIVGSKQLIRVAVVRDPAQAIPVAGSFSGPPGTQGELRVDVTVANVAG